MVPTAPDWPVWVGRMVTTHFHLVSGPFWAPRGPKRAPFGPKCPLALNFHGPILTWYRAPSGPLEALKGTVLARNAIFGGPRGPRRAPRDQIWSQLPPIGLPGLDSCSPHILTWYRAPSGPEGALKGLVLAPKGPFEDLGGPRRAPVGQIWSQPPSNGLMGLNLWSPHTLT